MSISLYDIEQILIAEGDIHGDGEEWWTFQNRAYDDDYAFDVPGVGVFTIQESQELTEGDWGGDEFIVFKLDPDDGSEPRYFRKSGYYRSFDGTEWFEGINEVKAIQKPVTVWENL